jgi:hypothetical protein
MRQGGNFDALENVKEKPYTKSCPLVIGFIKQPSNKSLAHI